MQLATDEIALELSPLGPVWVRPSLRAAYRLERRYGGFDKLLSAVSQGNVTAIFNVIGEATGRSNDWLSAIKGKALAPIIESLKAPLIRYVLALAGIDPERPRKNSGGTGTTYAEHHEKLFRLATGWLGWSPDDAWNATPGEIMNAYAGRAEMLKAIFGDGGSDGTEMSRDNFFKKYRGSTRAQ